MNGHEQVGVVARILICNTFLSERMYRDKYMQSYILESLVYVQSYFLTGEKIPVFFKWNCSTYCTIFNNMFVTNIKQLEGHPAIVESRSSWSLACISSILASEVLYTLWSWKNMVTTFVKGQSVLYGAGGLLSNPNWLWLHSSQIMHNSSLRTFSCAYIPKNSCRNLLHRICLVNWEVHLKQTTGWLIVDHIQEYWWLKWS